MATRKCEDCSNQISKRAKQCPHCGAPVKKKKTGCLGIIGLLFLVAVVIGIISTALNDESSPPPAQPAAAPKPKAKTTPPPSETGEPKARPQQPQPKHESPTPSKPAVPDWKSRQAELKAQFLPEFRAPEVGSRISLTLKGGSTQEGVIKSLTESEIQVERGSTTLGFIQSQLSTASRVRCFASDYATYKAYKQIKQEKDALASLKRAEKAALEAKQESEQQAAGADEKFQRWALDNTAVTDISINGPTMFVTLTADKYTNKDNVQQIADYLAKAYCMQTGKDGIVCRIYQGKRLYAKGDFYR